MLHVDLAEKSLELCSADEQDGINIVGQSLWLVEVEKVPSLRVEDVGIVEVRFNNGLVGLPDVKFLPEGSVYRGEFEQRGRSGGLVAEQGDFDSS